MTGQTLAAFLLMSATTPVPPASTDLLKDIGLYDLVDIEDRRNLPAVKPTMKQYFDCVAFRKTTIERPCK